MGVNVSLPRPLIQLGACRGTELEHEHDINTISRLSQTSSYFVYVCMKIHSPHAACPVALFACCR